MIQPHNIAISALIGFWKITHELKNKQISGWFRQITCTSEVKERWLLCDEVSAAPYLEPSAATHLQVSACKSSARAEKYSRYWWCWCLSPHSRHFSSRTLWPCCAQVSGTGETLALQKHKGGGWRCCRRASFQLASRCAGLLCQKGSQLPHLQAAGWRHPPGDLSKGQRPGCPSPECGYHPRALIPMAQEELLRRGVSSHWSIWPESLGSPCQVILHLCPQPGWGSGSGQSTSGCPAGLSSSAQQNEN